MSLYEHMAVVAILYALQWASVYTFYPRVWGITYGAVPLCRVLGYAALGIPLFGTLGYYLPYVFYPVILLGMTWGVHQVHTLERDHRLDDIYRNIK